MFGCLKIIYLSTSEGDAFSRTACIAILLTRLAVKTPGPGKVRIMEHPVPSQGPLRRPSGILR